jgi:tetratricopeptide (TPR) repeat protein
VPHKEANVNVVESSAQQQLDDAQALIERLQHPSERAQRAAASLRRAELLNDLGRRAEALAACSRLIEEFGGMPEPAVVVPCCQALRLLAHMLRQLHRPADALATLDRLVAAHGQRGEPEIREHIAHALYQRTWLIDEPAARCEACDFMSEQLDAQADAAFDAWRVDARLLKAEIDHHRGLPQDAIATLDAAIERFDGSTDPAVVLRVARARLASVLNLRELAQHTQAQVLCLQVADQIEAGLADAAPELRLEGVRALTLFFDGLGLEEQARRAELVGWLLERYGRDASSQVRRMAVVRAYDWAVGLRDQGDGEAALAACDRLLATFARDTDAVVQRTVASTLLNKGHVLLEQLARADDALGVYEKLMHTLRDAAAPELQDMRAKATAGRQSCLKRLRKAGPADAGELSIELRDEVRDKVKEGRRHGDAGESLEAIALFDEVLAAHAASLHPELRRQCARSLVHKAFCLVALSRFDEVIEAADAMDARYGADAATEMQEQVALCLQYKSTALDPPKYQRTEWKKIGAAKHSASTRSSRPLAPVTDARWPQAARRGRASGPSSPDARVIRPRRRWRPWPRLARRKGRDERERAAQQAADHHAQRPAVPVEAALTSGMLGGRFSLRVSRCCTTMQVWTTNTRKNTRKALLAFEIALAEVAAASAPARGSCRRRTP